MSVNSISTQTQNHFTGERAWYEAIRKALSVQLKAAMKPIMVALAVCFAIYALLNAIVGPLTAALSKAGAEYVITTTYPVANEDITGATVQWTELQEELRERIKNIETEFQGYDEYIYDINEMEHNPFELMAYLAAMHLEFTHPQVQAEIAVIFGEQNPLEIREETETRFRSDGSSYEYKKLFIALKPKLFEEVVTPRLEGADAKDLYDIFMGSGGNQQAFGNPFTFNWTNSISCYYGYREDPTGQMGGGTEFHTGLDLRAPENTPIRSVQQGVVTIAGWHNLYGNYVVISNPTTGITTLYAHCI